MEPAEIHLTTIGLPLTDLFYATCGQGPPLVIVPATISRIRDWQPLIRFMGQKFTTHLFELPGHGGSSPFLQHFSSMLVGQTVEDFINALNYDSITLMGFSFGGILTLRVLNQIMPRVNKLVLLSPCVSRHTLLYAPMRMTFIRVFLRIMLRPFPQAFFLRAIHNQTLVNYVLCLLRKVGNVEIYGPELRNTLLSLPASTLEVLTYQINEILNADPISEVNRTNTPCVFGMSRLDPLLNFGLTKKLIQDKFENVWVESFNLPYHQPPEPFTFDGLNRDYGRLLEKFSGFPQMKV
jgi:pimeloyl-ACP methyl ester carboxylesterase